MIDINYQLVSIIVIIDSAKIFLLETSDKEKIDEKNW